jgi:hypothetical protein
MEAINLANAKADLSELVGRVMAGEPIDAALLQCLTTTLPVSGETAADLVRAMRDGDPY